MIKKILFTAIFLLLLSGLYAQKVSFGVDAGLNLTKLPASANDVPTSNSYLAGFHAGGLVDIQFNSFIIQPGVLFTTKGGKNNFDVSLTDITGSQNTREVGTIKTTLDYIEVPLNFLYRLPTGPGYIFFGAGPYIAIGVSGKVTVDAKSDFQTTHQTENLTFGSGDNDIKNPDVGFNALVGYELKKGLMINAAYGQSFNSMNNNHVKNEGFSFSLGYFFR